MMKLYLFSKWKGIITLSEPKTKMTHQENSIRKAMWKIQDIHSQAHIIPRLDTTHLDFIIILSNVMYGMEATLLS